MELIVDINGDVAPRLGDVTMTDLEAIGHHAFVMQDVVRMLCAGVVHGDLSEFNVLLDEYGPVIIDLQQAVNASANNNAKAMLERDVENMTNYFGQFSPDLLETNFGKEIWQLFEDGELRPDTVLTGEYEESEEAADVDGVMVQIQEAFKEEQERLERIRQANEED
jgi:RIO kinase 1